MRRILLYLLFYLLTASGTIAQSFAYYDNLYEIPHYSIFIKKLSRGQVYRINKITKSTLGLLDHFYTEFYNLKVVLNQRLENGEDIEGIKNAIQELDSAIIETKLTHFENIRLVFTPEQVDKFDEQYNLLAVQSDDYKIHLVSINNIYLPSHKRKRNIIKTNLVAAGLKNINLAYQRQIGSRWALNFSFTYMPETQTPFANRLDNLIMDYNPTTDDMGISVNNPLLNLTTQGWGTNVGIRYFLPYKEYLSSRSVSGIYFGPFAFYNSYDYSSKFRGSMLQNDFNVNANLNFQNTGTGILAGNQWAIKNTIIVDFTFMGLSYNQSTLDGIVKTTSSDVSIKDYVNEFMDLKLEIYQSSQKKVTDNQLYMENKKAKLGFMVACSVGFLF